MSLQLKVLTIAPKVTGMLSLLSSSAIVYNVMSLPPVKRQQIYSRLMFAISLSDIFMSFCFFLSTWPIPKGSGPLYASGNQWVCTLQGFILQFGIAGPGYNTSLAIYYWAVLVLQWNDRKIKESLATPLYVVPFVISLGLAVSGLFMTIYNNAGFWCWAASIPGVCGGDSGVSCKRGKHAQLFRWAMFYGPLWFCIVFVTILMIFVFVMVWKTEKASAAYRARNQDKKFASEDSLSGKHSAANDSRRSAESKISSKVMSLFRRRNKQSEDADTRLKLSLTRKLFWQSLFYVLAFYVAWIFPTITRIFQGIGKPVPYPILVLTVLLLPLQGVFNAFIYFRPRYTHWVNQRKQAARRKKKQQTRVSSITMGSIVAGDIDEEDITSDQVGNLEMESNPAYALSIAADDGIQDRRLVGFHKHENMVINIQQEKSNNNHYVIEQSIEFTNIRDQIATIPEEDSAILKELSFNNRNSSSQTKNYILEETAPSTDNVNNNLLPLLETSQQQSISMEKRSNHETQQPTQNLVQELKNNSFVHVKGPDLQSTSAVYASLFAGDEQPSFDAIYQLPSHKKIPEPGTLYGDLHQIYDIMNKASLSNNDDYNEEGGESGDNVWEDEDNLECRDRIEYELDGITTILIVDLKGKSEESRIRWEEFVAPLLSSGDIKVLALTP